MQLTWWLTGDIQESQQHSYTFHSTWMYGTLEGLLRERGLFWPSISNAITRLSTLRICQKRVWDLSLTDAREKPALPAIVDLASCLNMDAKCRHVNCTPQTCYLAEENSTQKTQLHKCTSPDECCLTDFDVTKLDIGFYDTDNEFVVPAWRLEPVGRGWGLVTESNMAISHVWSDGTCVGLRSPGTVNTCLFNYFAELAKQEGCRGLWWDVISLPRSRPAKRKALNSMHTIYNCAHFVLVHDLGLANTVCRDDGSPCLALVLSDWFTRGWIALELWAGQKVKVLFRTSCGNPILINLYEDILAPFSIFGPCLAHRLASDLVKHARVTSAQEKGHPKKSLPISRLLHILLPRSTSFTKDKLIVAGLMAGVDGLDLEGWPEWIAKQILLAQGDLGHSLLFHDKIPMSQHGPWSWCAPSLLDFSKPDYRFTFRVRPDGSVVGEVRAILVTAEVAKALYPVTPHVTGRLRVTDALKDWESCLLIKQDDASEDEGRTKYLLVSARRLAVRGSIIAKTKVLILVVLDCAYVGTVPSRTPVGKPVDQISVWFGCDTGGSPMKCLPELIHKLCRQIQWDWEGMELRDNRSWHEHIKNDNMLWRTLVQVKDFVSWHGWNDIDYMDAQGDVESMPFEA